MLLRMILLVSILRGENLSQSVWAEMEENSKHCWGELLLRGEFILHVSYAPVFAGNILWFVVVK